jgi:clan AA aspartic protease (TIGR02281 family)
MQFHLGNRKILVFSLFILSAGLGVPGISTGQEVNSQTAEARDFFRRVASQSHNPLIAGLAQENVIKLQQPQRSDAPLRQVVIPLMEQPDTSLVVPILINSNVMATFLVDTGSSYTVITPALASKLGIKVTPDTPRISLATANGLIEAPMVTLRNVSVGAIRVSEVSVVIQQLGNGDDILLSGLLGMNFFKGMDLTVRNDQLVIGLRSTSPVYAK